MGLYELGKVARTRGDPAGAAALDRESLALGRVLPMALEDAADDLEGLAWAALATGRPAGAARPLGAAAALRRVSAGPQSSELQPGYEATVVAVPAALGEAALAAAWADGEALTAEEAVAEALADE